MYYAQIHKPHPLIFGSGWSIIKKENVERYHIAYRQIMIQITLDICLTRGQKTVNIFKMLKIRKIQSIISISSTPENASRIKVK